MPSADTIRPIDDHLPWAAGYAGDALRCARHVLFEHGDEPEVVEAIALLEQAKRALAKLKKRKESANG